MLMVDFNSEKRVIIELYNLLITIKLFESFRTKLRFGEALHVGIMLQRPVILLQKPKALGICISLVETFSHPSTYCCIRKVKFQISYGTVSRNMTDR
jgi:hypothetical protein